MLTVRFTDKHMQRAAVQAQLMSPRTKLLESWWQLRAGEKAKVCWLLSGLICARFPSIGSAHQALFDQVVLNLCDHK
ncbi:hypothetical protein D3C85_1105080 [compost metagenome]